MSADAYLTLRCDRAECEYPEGHWPIRFEPYTHRELRRLLKTRGWARTRNEDHCPSHARASAGP